MNKKGATEIRGIFLDTSRVEEMRLSSKAFKGMCNLRYLKIYNSHCSRGCEDDCRVQFPKELTFLPEGLTYLQWQGCPLQNLPPDFNPKNLVDLKLQVSHIRQFWDDDKDTGKLKWVDLSHSLKLRKICGLSKAQNLERLNLEGCASLKKFPSSMNCLEKLVYLNLRGCTSLISLPKGFKLESLQTVILSGCSSLEKFPQISETVEVLLLDGTAIKSLPESIESLRKLTMLNLKNCKKLDCLSSDLYKLKSLRELILSGCSSLETFPEIKEDMESMEILLVDETAIKEMPKIMHLSNIKTFSFCRSNSQISIDLLLPPFSGCSVLTDLYLSGCNLYKLPNNVSGLSSLQFLCLSNNCIEKLPENIEQLHNLKWFDLKYCKMLRSLPVLPPNLQYLDAHGCESLEIVESPLTPLMGADRIHSLFIFSNCFKLTQKNVLCHARIRSQLMAYASVKDHYRGFISDPLVGICLPGSEIPGWIRYQSLGNSLETPLPPHWCGNRFVGFALSAVVSLKNYEECSKSFSVKCSCKFKNEDGSSTSFSCKLGGWNEPCASPGHGPRTLASDHVFLGYNSCFHIKKCGVESNNLNNGCYTTKASFKFYVTDDTKKKLKSCEVIKCGMSLMYAPDEDECRLMLKKSSPVQVSSTSSTDEARLCHGLVLDHENGPKRERCRFADEDEPNCKRVVLLGD